MHSLHPKLFLPAAHAIGAAAVACALLVFYLTVHRPLVNRKQTDSEACQALKQGLRDSLEVRREHLQLTRRLETLNGKVANANARIPKVSAESRFLAHATNAAGSNRINLHAYEREGLSVEDGHGEVCVVLHGVGSHAAICRFLKSLDDFPNAVVLVALEISSSNSTTNYPFEAKYSLFHSVGSPATARSAQTAGIPR